MTHNRPARIAELIHSELSQILLQHVSDPRLSSISITAVDLSPDLRVARIHYLPLGGQGDPKEIQAGLHAARGFMRRLLGEALQLRYVPSLVFMMDQGLDDAVRLTHLLQDLEASHKETVKEPEE